jgi:multiple sugar transport system permease protein
MVIIGFIIAYPLLYILYLSLKNSTSRGELASGFSVRYWRAILSQEAFWTHISNSIVVTVCSVLIIVALSVPAGYAFAKLLFPGAKVILPLVLACLMVPIQSIIVPIYGQFAKVGIVDTYLAPILIYAAIGMPFGIYLMTAFYRGLPDTILEAGYIDGLGRVGAFWKLMVPLSVPSVGAVAILQTILIWNDLLVSLLTLPSAGNRTISVAIGVLASGQNTSLPRLMAEAILSAVPMLIVYVFFRRYLVRGLVAGADR